jgi:hypothetical protein
MRRARATRTVRMPRERERPPLTTLARQLPGTVPDEQ